MSTTDMANSEVKVVVDTNTDYSPAETCVCGYHYKDPKPYETPDQVDLTCPFICNHEFGQKFRVNYPDNYNRSQYCNCAGATGPVIIHYNEGLLNKALIESQDKAIPMFLLGANCDLKGCFKNILKYGNMELMKFLIEKRGYYPCFCDLWYIEDTKDRTLGSLLRQVFEYLIHKQIIVKCHPKPIPVPVETPVVASCESTYVDVYRGGVCVFRGGVPVSGVEGITGYCGPTGPTNIPLARSGATGYYIIAKRHGVTENYPPATGPQGVIGATANTTSLPSINNKVNKLFYAVPSESVDPGTKFPGLVLNEQFKETSTTTCSLSGFYINFDELVSQIATYSLILETICHNKTKPKFYSVSNS